MSDTPFYDALMYKHFRRYQVPLLRRFLASLRRVSVGLLKAWAAPLVFCGLFAVAVWVVWLCTQ